MINKVLAGIITISFMTLVRPDPAPSRMGFALVAILIYETAYFCIKYVRRMRRKRAKERNDAWLHYDGRRWAAERLDWPMYEEVI